MNINSYTGTYIQKKDHHLYIAPDPALQDIIAHYTITYSSGKANECDHYHIIPDASGCFIMQGERFDFWGAMSDVAIVKNDIEEVEERLFVEFLPGGLYQVSGKSQHMYANQRAPLSIFDKEVEKQLRALMKKCNTYDEAIHQLNQWFMKRRKENCIPLLFQDVLFDIQEKHGMMSIQSIVQAHAISNRQLLRMFHKYIGISPKEYSNILRFNHLLKELSKESFVDTAIDTGFFDQAHFNKVFKKITHTTPTNYIENAVDFYQELLKF